MNKLKIPTDSVNFTVSVGGDGAYYGDVRSHNGERCYNGSCTQCNGAGLSLSDIKLVTREEPTKD